MQRYYEVLPVIKYHVKGNVSEINNLNNQYTLYESQNNLIHKILIWNERLPLSGKFNLVKLLFLVDAADCSI